MAPPPPLLPRLPEGWAGAGAGRGVAEAGARAAGHPPRLAASPSPPRPPGLRHPPSPGFCEVALTWQSLRGRRSARPRVSSPGPRSPPQDLQERAASRFSRCGSPGAALLPGASGDPWRSRVSPRSRGVGSTRPHSRRAESGAGPGDRVASGVCQVLCFQ